MVFLILCILEYLSEENYILQGKEKISFAYFDCGIKTLYKYYKIKGYF